MNLPQTLAMVNAALAARHAVRLSTEVIDISGEPSGTMT